MGEDPHLWSQTRVRITTRAASFLSDIISSSKMKLLRDLKLEQCVSAKTAESVLRLIIEHGKIESLNVSGNKLSLVSCQTMGQLARMLRRLVAENCRLTSSQLETLFQVIDEDKDCQIKTLMIGNNSLSGIKFHNLGDAVSKLSSFHCDNSCLTVPQLTKILNSLSSEGCQLEDLNLMQNNLLTIHHPVIARGLANLKSVNLWGTDAICFSLFTEMAEGRSKLKKLNLGDADLSYYPPALVTNSLISLTEADLSYATMSPIQLNMLLSTIVTTNTSSLQTLIMLNLRGFESPIDDELSRQVQEKIPKFEISFQ